MLSFLKGGFPARTISHFPTVSCPIYHIDLQQGDGEVGWLLTLNLYAGNQHLGETRVSLSNVSNITAMINCYIAMATYNFEKETQRVSLENMYNFIGTFLWGFLHPNEYAKNLWEIFTSSVKMSNEKVGIVIATGLVGQLTFPIESLSNHAVGLHLAIIKGNYNTWRSLLERSLPKKIVLVLGSEKAGENDKLDFRKELSLIQQRLCPSNDNVEYDSYLYYGGTIESQGIVGHYTVDIISPRDDVTVLAERIRSIKEPYLLIYSGHGFYNDKDEIGYFNGQLCLRHDQLGHASISHELFAEQLSYNPPFGIILNCCNGLRKVDFQCRNQTEATSMDFLFERSYKKLNEQTNFIVVFKSKICDCFGHYVTRSVVESLCENLDIVSFLGKLRAGINEIKYNIEDEKHRRDCQIRDKSSGVYWLVS